MTRRQSPTETLLHRHPHLWPMLDPKTYPTGYFLEPVLKWFPHFVPSDWCSKGFVGSKAATAAREEALASNDAQRKWAAIGNLGELRKVRK